jgi:hypothetical protein
VIAEVHRIRLDEYAIALSGYVRLRLQEFSAILCRCRARLRLRAKGWRDGEQE